GKTTRVRIEALSSRDALLGRFQSLRLELGRLGRGIRLRQAVLDCKSLDLGFKPALLALTPLILLLRPSAFLPLLLIFCFAPSRLSQAGPSSSGTSRSTTSVSATISGEDLSQSSVWKFLLTTALRDIMNYSIAGLVVLPREVSGELSSATRFELEGVDVTEKGIEMDAAAFLENNTIFRYKLRTGASIIEVNGEQVIFWEDPCIQVTPGWPLPVFWFPIGGFAGRRIGNFLRLTRLQFTAAGIELEGSLGGTGGGALVPVRGVRW
ncbi:unnamed protein product, partial [Polarella glacialis]